MKIKEYNEMMRYLTRPSYNKPKEQPYYMTNLATGGLDNVNATPKRDILDYINQVQNTDDGVPLSEKNNKINAAEIKKAKGGIIKDSTYTTYSNGGTAKNQKKNDKKLSYTEEYNQYFGGGIPKKKTPLATEKNNIVIAMSETPSEEFQLDLSTEIEQFQEWLKNNKNGTYKEFLEDKTAFLTEEQKKDPKIIELPLPFTFQEELDRMLEEEEKNTEKDESYKRGFDEGIQSILRVRKV